MAVRELVPGPVPGGGIADLAAGLLWLEAERAAVLAEALDAAGRAAAAEWRAAGWEADYWRARAGLYWGFVATHDELIAELAMVAGRAVPR